MPFRNQTALHAKIVFLRFQAVILTTGNAEFELVGQLPAKIPGIQRLGNLQSIDTSAGATPPTLTCGNSAHAGTAHAGGNIAFSQSRLYLVNILKLDKGNLNALTGSQMYVALAIFICHCLDGCQLLGSNGTAYHPQTQGKSILLLLAHEASRFQRRVIYCHNDLSS